LSGKLKQDLKYQADDEFMMHEKAVVSICFSPDSEYLASGSTDGKIKVWQIRTGKCLRRYENAHTGAVNSLVFTKDSSQLLSSSQDQTIRIHGLKSGKTLKVFRGHKSFVNDAIFNQEGNRVISAGSDATVKIWDTKTTDCLNSFRPVQETTGVEIPVISVRLLPNNPEQLVVLNRSHLIYIMTIKGKIHKTLASSSTTDNGTAGSPFVCCLFSPKGDWLYAVSEDKTLHCFDMNNNGKLEHTMKVHEKDVTALSHHPHQNLLATISLEGTVKFWKP